jgi:hypothetical protein
MENAIVNVGAGSGVVGVALARSRRSRLDELLARHRQRRLESLAFWLGVAAVMGSLLLV